jgi:hypothetical protein
MPIRPPVLLSFEDTTGEDMLLYDAARVEFSLASWSAAAEKYSRSLIGGRRRDVSRELIAVVFAPGPLSLEASRLWTALQKGTGL